MQPMRVSTLLSRFRWFPAESADAGLRAAAVRRAYNLHTPPANERPLPEGRCILHTEPRGVPIGEIPLPEEIRPNNPSGVLRIRNTSSQHSASFLPKCELPNLLRELSVRRCRGKLRARNEPH